MRRTVLSTFAALGLAVGTVIFAGSVERAAAQTAVDVGMGRYAFEPADLVAPVGPVTFNLWNTDSRKHNMVIDVHGTFVQSEIIDAGGSGAWDVVLEHFGTYQFWCDVDDHFDRGMVGTLTVQ